MDWDWIWDLRALLEVLHGEGILGPLVEGRIPVEKGATMSSGLQAKGSALLEGLEELEVIPVPSRLRKAFEAKHTAPADYQDESRQMVGSTSWKGR